MALRLKRQLNYTNRANVASGDVQVEVGLSESGCAKVRILKLDLTSAGSRHEPDEWAKARVILESRRLATSSFDRHDAGSVAETTARPAPKVVRQLNNFKGVEGISFTLKVVSTKSGRLLAIANDLVAHDDMPPDAEELIQVIPKDIGEEVWRLDWKLEDGAPYVLVNSKLIDAAGFLRRDAVMEGMVMPSILRGVLQRLVLDPSLREESWAVRWLKFARRYSDLPLPDGSDEGIGWDDAQEWVNPIVEAFCNEFTMRTRINALLDRANEGEA